MLFVTGGAGFIGSNFILAHLDHYPDETVVNIDTLTYAGNPHNLASLAHHPHYVFTKTDICNGADIARLFQTHRPRALVHFAAESHVDRSIISPAEFIRTNVTGTFTLLEAVRHYWSDLPAAEKSDFRFLHVSTDEVYGTLGADDSAFSETTPYAPNSPYSASKAASDHLVRAYFHTYGLPTLTTNCSNNYGPFHFPEKLIPLVILNALDNKPLPVYGDGQQIRDWLYVTDHCTAIRAVLDKGRIGETYNIGGHNEMTNLDVIQTLCDILQVLSPKAQGHYRDLITYVTDRPGHDRRYAINAEKIATELGWLPTETFDTGIKKTVQWYLDNPEWVNAIRTGTYLK